MPGAGMELLVVSRCGLALTQWQISTKRRIIRPKGRRGHKVSGQMVTLTGMRRMKIHPDLKLSNGPTSSGGYLRT